MKSPAALALQVAEGRLPPTEEHSQRLYLSEAELGVALEIQRQDLPPKNEPYE